MLVFAGALKDFWHGYKVEKMKVGAGLGRGGGGEGP